MKRCIKTSVIIISLAIFFGQVQPVAAQVPVSATIEEQSFNAPTLLSPSDNSTITTTLPTFSWQRPTPLPSSPLHHYDFYLDGEIFAASLSDSLVLQDYYFYTATASGEIFYLTLKSDLEQGYHTWSVTAYSDAGVSSASSTWTFYLDSIPPFIQVSSVDDTDLIWNTAVPTSIPDETERYLTVDNAYPLVSGTVETSANFQITLICPQNIPSCTNQTYTSNAPLGTWQFRFNNLAQGYTYTLQASATDAAGNITIFPYFYLTYGIPTVTPTAFPTPTPTIVLSPTPLPSLTVSPTISPEPTLPLPSTTLTPPPYQLVTITPTQYIPGPPISPTPPPPVKRKAARATDLFVSFMLILIIIGLPLHLTMTIIGTKTPLKFIPRFLFILAYPFFSSHKYRTVPFAFIEIYKSDELSKPWQTVVSSIKGFFHLKHSIPESIFVTITGAGLIWNDTIMKGSLLPISCLYPRRETSPNTQKTLSKTIYDMRIIPLLMACITSTAVQITSPSYPVLIYMYLSYQYFFSEYIYPKI